jgi:hypothetical protein
MLNMGVEAWKNGWRRTAEGVDHTYANIACA